MATIGKYKGIDINAGTDEEVARQIAAIDKGQSSSSSSSSIPASQSAGSYKGVTIRKGSDADIAKQMADIDKQQSSSNKSSKSTTTKTSTPAPKVESKFSSSDARDFARSQGLGSSAASQFSGLTKSQANAKAAQIKEAAKRQTSSLTSYSFNPDTAKKTKEILEGFNTKMKDAMNNAWNSVGTKQEKSKGILEATANEYARLFTDPAQFDEAYNTNQEFRSNIDAFAKSGGDKNAIKGRIKAPVSVLGYRDNPDGSTTNFLSDGQRSDVRYQENDDGTVTAVEQSTTDYLSSLGLQAPAGATAYQSKAYETLLPERELAQKEIMRTAGIPEKYKDLYFGTPEQVGILQQKRIQAEESKKILERKAKQDAADLKAQARFAIDRNNADLEIAEAEIEENRLAAKNYMTGMLAKLGALNTTGEAPVAIAKLEQKYQQQSLKIRNDVKFKNREIGVKLTDAVNDIEIKRDEDILAVRADLTKDEETAMKEIFNLEKAADERIYSITDKASSEMRAQVEKYRLKAEQDSKEYITKQESLMRTYDPNALLARYGVTNRKPATGSGSGGSGSGRRTGGTEAERKAATIADYEEAFTPGNRLDDGTPTVDANGFITVVAWKEALKEAPSMGLTRSEFIKSFGYMLAPDEKDGLPMKTYGLTGNERALLK